jgi:hypothetical protein
MQEIYDIKYTVVMEHHFRSAEYLKDVVTHIFKEKSDAKASGDKITEFMSKLKINNLYGKLGQNYNKSQVFYGDYKDIPRDYVIDGKVREVSAIFNQSGFNVFKKVEPTDKVQPVHIASFITSMSRVSLISKYLEIQKLGGKFLYCDTDSIVYYGVDDNSKITKIGTQLGD